MNKSDNNNNREEREMIEKINRLQVKKISNNPIRLIKPSNNKVKRSRKNNCCTCRVHKRNNNRTEEGTLCIKTILYK